MQGIEQEMRLQLQPLVENAIRHGSAERAGCGVIEVRARLQDGRLLLEVEDDGPGAAAATAAASAGVRPGLGLAATAERLQLLYGDGQSFSAGNGSAGGFLVRVCLPPRWGAAAPTLP